MHIQSYLFGAVVQWYPSLEAKSSLWAQTIWEFLQIYIREYRCILVATQKKIEVFCQHKYQKLMLREYATPVGRQARKMKQPPLKHRSSEKGVIPPLPTSVQVKQISNGISKYCSSGWCHLLDIAKEWEILLNWVLRPTLGGFKLFQCSGAWALGYFFRGRGLRRRMQKKFAPRDHGDMPSIPLYQINKQLKDQ